MVDVCALVDRLSPHDTGEFLVFRSGVVVEGAIFVEGGRICWAAAHGLAPRLTELLVARSGIDARAMEDSFRRCKREEVPLGEFLVARGVVGSDDLRAALLQHTTESLDMLCSRGASASWHGRRGGYSSRFTFKTSELLATWFAHVHGTSPYAEALASFSDAIPNEWGSAFVRVQSFAHPVPIAVRGALPEKSTLLLQIGKWAASALDVAATFQESDAFVTATEDTGSSLVAWRHDRAIVAGRMSSQGPARILNHRAMLRRRAAAQHQR